MIYIYNNKERELELYTSSNSNLENFNIKINEDLLNKTTYNKFKVCKKVSKIIGSYYSDSSKTQGKSYLLEYDNKILGFIFIRYYYNIKYTDDAFLDEICNNLSIIISKIKFDDKLKADEKISLTNYLINYSKNNYIS
ncbi:hypothetical protein CYK79_16225 [Clostridium perfringens]|nr:hypothetical protein CYK79_16225 [Clostridium perfringens]PWW89134.1 hypothetical protein CYK84_15905 [Clostridium perfringens]PWX64548.1 hypothetical protein CYK78_16615 [Clostridium perfringens]